MVHITDLSTAFLLVSGFIALGLLAVAIMGYRRTREPSMAFLAGAFTLFAAKSFLVAYAIRTGLIEHELLELVDAIGDLGTVLLILVPVFWPARKP